MLTTLKDMHKTSTAKSAIVLQGSSGTLYLTNTRFTTKLLNQLGYLRQTCCA